MVASAHGIARTLGIGILAASVATLAAACGQAPTTSTGGTGGTKGTTQSQWSRAQAYASCMRSQGLANFPDPTTGNGSSSGGSGPSISIGYDGMNFNFAGTGIDPRSSTFQAAQKVCQPKLGIPAFSSGPVTQQMKQAALAFAACIRAHGFPTFPDPSFGAPPAKTPGSGAPGQPQAVIGIASKNGGSFFFKIPSAVDLQSQQWQTAMSTCQSKLPGKQGPGQ